MYKVVFLLEKNPFRTSSASANRWLTLINGLNNLNVSIQIIIYGHYQSTLEKKTTESHSSISGIQIRYITDVLHGDIWKKRYYKYIGNHIHAIKISRIIRNELTHYNGIVWTDNYKTIWKIVASIKNKSFKLVTEMSEFLDIHYYNKTNYFQRRLGNSKKNYFENVYIKRIDALVLMTQTLINHYQNFENKPVLFHLPMTVDLERFSAPLEILAEFQAPYIAFVGVMNDAKDGVDVLIKSFAAISNNFPDYKLYLVGLRNYDTPSHLKMIQDLGMNGRIEWKGAYDRDKIPHIIQNADLLVLPRPDSKQAQGGFPTKLGEYLATGNPVCATRVGEIPNYLKDNESVFFAEPGSVESFAEAMTRALSNETLAKEVGEKGREVAQKYFNKDIQARKLYEFLKELQNA